MRTVHYLYDYVLACVLLCVRERQRKGGKDGRREKGKEREGEGEISFAEKMEEEEKKGGFIKDRTE